MMKFRHVQMAAKNASKFNAACSGSSRHFFAEPTKVYENYYLWNNYWWAKLAQRATLLGKCI
jgi:hypothetical protein